MAFSFITARRLLLTAAAAGFIFTADAASSQGVYHTVRRGDTLYAISRAYDVSLDRIKGANEGLTNRIIPGQKIFIPVAGRIVEPLTGQMNTILGLGRSERWQYIVIHHSGTTSGGAESFERNHINRGFRALGYHFVIGNGTDTSDGKIEIGLRWRNQWDGAHARGEANKAGIGICLVGNFENSRPTPKQMQALVRLVTHLAYRYDIPLSGIRGHKDFDEGTRCPGRNFPWGELRTALRLRGIG